MRRKGNLRQKIMVGFLSAMLVTGMVAGAVPTEAFAAEENMETVESVSESTTESVAEETGTKSETEPGTVTETVKENETKPETVTEDETELETVTENEAKPETVVENETKPETLKENEVEPEAVKENEAKSETVTEDETEPEAITGEAQRQAEPAPDDDIIVTSDGWKFNKTSGALTIENDTGMRNWKYNGGLFETSSVKSVVIDSEVPQIRGAGFQGCSGLKTITILEDSKMTSIGNYAFDGCSSLTSITIPKSVTKIGYYAFKGCDSLRTITIESGSTMTEIGDQAFYGCGGLESITIPKSVTKIGENAFEDCSKLKSITIPSSVKELGSSCFMGCSSLQSISIEGPSEMTSIGECCFYNCSSLKSITIPDGVTKIGSQTFYNCSGLKSITIPESVTEIGYIAFRECGSLESITIPNNSKMTSIGTEAFVNCSALKSITIPSGVTEISSHCFQKCKNLESVEIPDNSKMTSIGEGAFDGCYGLTSIKIPDGMTEIGKSAFNYCTNLKSIEIPDSVTKIVGDAFDHCEKLETVTVKAEDPPEITIGSDVFSDCNKLATIYVPEGTKGAYDIAEGWKRWASKIQESPHVHTFSTDWSKDAENHWHAATCKHAGEVVSDKAAHDYDDWTVTKEATESAKGSKKRSCEICGYEQTAEIPVKTQEDTGEGKTETDKNDTSAGKIETTREVGENTPNADFGSTEDVLIGAVLSTGDRDLVKAGTDIKIILDIDNIDASVSQSDKQAATDKADGYNVGQYLDINLYKLIGENKEKISKTNDKIRIVIAVPEAVKNTDSKKTRSYAVVRVHDGVADLLGDLDNNEATITIETDRFSTYALVYKDSTGGDTKKTDQNLSPATGDDTPIEMFVVLIMLAGLSGLTLFTANRKKNMRK